MGLFTGVLLVCLGIAVAVGAAFLAVCFVIIAAVEHFERRFRDPF